MQVLVEVGSIGDLERTVSIRILLRRLSFVGIGQVLLVNVGSDQDGMAEIGLA